MIYGALGLLDVGLSSRSVTAKRAFSSNLTAASVCALLTGLNALPPCEVTSIRKLAISLSAKSACSSQYSSGTKALISVHVQLSVSLQLIERPADKPRATFSTTVEKPCDPQLGP